MFLNFDNLKSFRAATRKGNHVALTSSIPADLDTPVSSFLKVAASAENAFLLESAEQGEKVGRYSILSSQPDEVLLQEKGCVYSLLGKKKVALKGRHILETLKQKLKNRKLVNPEELPEFCGGYVGYFSYENVEYFEKIKLSKKKGPETPKAVFFLTKSFIIFDHYRKTIKLVSILDLKEFASVEKAYNAGNRQLNKLAKELQKPLKSIGMQKVRGYSELKSNMSKKNFESKVNRIKEYIKAGDCIQVVLSQRFTTKAPKEDFQIYRALRSINPSPYMFYFRCGHTRLIGASPELLVKNENRVAEVRPIAGTRPRGKTAAEDQAYKDSLISSVKEMAEHVMLVDLGRNDLGRVCEFESVEVNNYAHVENYSHVMHLVSDVRGRLKSGKDRFDLLKATFPAGTVSGAPKIRAMQIIDELEEESRGAYAGCLGYFSFKKDMEVCITIRTIVVEGKKMYLQAGAGIVKDSNPHREYLETVNKAKAMVQAIKDQEQYS